MYVSDSPPHVISQQWQVETQGEPLGRTEEHHTEEEMDEIFWEDQLKRTKCIESIRIVTGPSNACLQNNSLTAHTKYLRSHMEYMSKLSCSQ